MRHVFPTGEIAHKWAHQTQDSARNPQGNLYFRGDTLYSYRDSYPIARLFKKKGARPSIGENGPGGLLNSTVRAAHEGKTLALHVENTYSSTTAGHCSDARRATSHLPSIVVPYPAMEASTAQGLYGACDAATKHKENVAYLVNLAGEHLSKAQRAQMLRNVAWRRAAAEERLADAQAYSAFFGIRRKVPAFPELAWNAAAARAERIENPDPVRDAKRFKLREQRAAQSEAVTEYREEMARRMTEASHGYLGYRVTIGKRWPAMLARKTGEKGENPLHVMADRTMWRLNELHQSYGFHRDPVMLRVNGDQIETSQGARIPLAAAPLIWRIVEHARTSGGRVYAGRDGYMAGDYRIDRVTNEGELVAGCHRIPHSELRSMARALNLA